MCPCQAPTKVHGHRHNRCQANHVVQAGQRWLGLTRLHHVGRKVVVAGGLVAFGHQRHAQPVAKPAAAAAAREAADQVRKKGMSPGGGTAPTPLAASPLATFMRAQHVLPAQGVDRRLPPHGSACTAAARKRRGTWRCAARVQACAAAHLQLVVVASPHQNSTWWNLCMGKRSERGLWRCGGCVGVGVAGV